MTTATGATCLKTALETPRLSVLGTPLTITDTKKGTKTYGSGYFGEWIEDEFGLPAFHYTCKQENDPKAVTRVSHSILSPTEHIHQVGNDRLIAVASNYGHIRVRQDEGGPKFLNDYAPEDNQFGGGIGYLCGGNLKLTTLYPGNASSFDRVFGVGYLRKRVTGGDYLLDHVILVPFGDDPVLISQVTISNRGNNSLRLRWVEYWGCQPYQFSFRSSMEAGVARAGDVIELRRRFSRRFTHRFRFIGNKQGLLETKEFHGRSADEETAWKKVKAILAAKPELFFKEPAPIPVKEVCYDDFNPPATFLASLDAPADGVATNGNAFFGPGGVNQPNGLERELDDDLNTKGTDSALLLERKFKLDPGETRTLYFIYGYLPEGAELNSLLAKYQVSTAGIWKDSSRRWKESGMQFSTGVEPWIAREVTRNHYCLRSNLTYDSFFKDHILSQGGPHQYVSGFQGAARDPLHHFLPFIFSDPEIVKEILRYTLIEVRPDGSISYGMVDHGVMMPTELDNASDFGLWLLWVSSEYMLANCDLAILSEQVSTYPLYGPSVGRQSVRDLLFRCYRYLIDQVRT